MARMTHLDCVEISPPEVGGEQLVILVQGVEVEGQLLGGVEVHHVDVGVSDVILGQTGGDGERKGEQEGMDGILVFGN